MHWLLAFVLVEGGSRRIQFSLSPVRSLGEVKKAAWCSPVTADVDQNCKVIRCEFW